MVNLPLYFETQSSIYKVKINRERQLLQLRQHKYQPVFELFFFLPLLFFTCNGGSFGHFDLFVAGNVGFEVFAVQTILKRGFDE